MTSTNAWKRRAYARTADAVTVPAVSSACAPRVSRSRPPRTRAWTLTSAGPTPGCVGTGPASTSTGDSTASASPASSADRGWSARISMSVGSTTTSVGTAGVGTASAVSVASAPADFGSLKTKETVRLGIFSYLYLRINTCSRKVMPTAFFYCIVMRI